MSKITLLTTLVLATAAQAQTVKTLFNNGPTSNRYDIVIIGDGYQAHEQVKFDADCTKFATALFQKEPYKTFANHYNIHTVYRASAESGADHPDVTPQIWKNTVYDASYNTGGTPRCLYIKNTGRALADAALAPANEGRILVLVNDSRYGGCGGTFAVSYNGTSMNEVQIHEMGHSVGGLADEYWYSGTTHTGGEPGQVNATANSAGAKWGHWLGSNGVSTFEGCRYREKGLWRPLNNCLMRSLNRPLCSVCAEGLVLTMRRAARPIENISPAQGAITLLMPAAQTFSFTSIIPAANNPTFIWKLDGQVVATGTTSYRLTTTNRASGVHRLTAEIEDNSTMVRKDPLGRQTETLAWTVTIIDTTRPDLTISAIVTQPLVLLTAGELIDIDTTIVNGGLVSAGAFVVDHYLVLGGVFDPKTDPYLGRIQVSGLGARSQTVQKHRGVRLPAYLAPAWYKLGTVVDATGQIGESNEANNKTVTYVSLAAPACTPVLEYRDPALYPRNNAQASVSAATPVLPTVVSACNPGAIYVIVWGISGTTPGTPLASGITLPLNLDAFSTLSLAAQNTPNFANFLGTLDTFGVGKASFSLQGAPFLGNIKGHFAAAILDSGLTRFTAVTNAVVIEVIQ